jgi:RNA polymerase sigma factor (sigma-70 family)
MAPTDTINDPISAYLGEIGRNEVLTRDEERDLFQRLEGGDESARERIIACNLRFVVKIAAQFRGRGMPLGDLIQEGNIGLLEVLDKFDWRRGYRFSTYAAFWIRQAIQRALLRSGSMVRLPSRKARLLGRLNGMIESHRAEFHRDPTLEEMSIALDTDPEVLASLMRWRESVLSLDTPIDDDGGQLMDTVADDPAESPFETLLEDERREQVDRALERLSEKEQAVLRLRFGFQTGKELSLRKTSARIGLSQEGVRRLERVALNKMRRRAQRQELACLL